LVEARKGTVGTPKQRGGKVNKGYKPGSQWQPVASMSVLYEPAAAVESRSRLSTKAKNPHRPYPAVFLAG